MIIKGYNMIERNKFVQTGVKLMGKRRNSRFPQSINGANGFFYPNRYMHPITDPNSFNGTRYFNANPGYDNGSDMYSPTDTWGSYTGVPADGSERPIQDADDL